MFDSTGAADLSAGGESIHAYSRIETTKFFSIELKDLANKDCSRYLVTGMPTRTERLALPTFVAKLSRGNPWRKRKTHQQYDALFREKFWLVKGYKTVYNTSVKKEWLAAVNWLGYYSKDRAMLEALDHADLLTITDMFEIGNSGSSIPEYIDAIMHCQPSTLRV